MSRTFDCVVCGSCVVDLLCRPVSLDEPIGEGVLHATDAVVLTAGGITSNAGVALARLGLTTGVFSYVGDDAWAPVVRNLYRENGLDDAPLMTHPTEPTSTTVVAIDETGERSFFHCVGAPKQLNAQTFLDHLDLFENCRMMLLGYYSLMPNLEPDLDTVLAKLQSVGCQTALDAAGEGGTMDPLEKLLPHLDVYVPSLNEAENQTGESDPQRILKRYRAAGSDTLLGVKLGRNGVLLSPAADQYVEISTCQPDGEVVDTTGAGDTFYAGLLAGLLKGLNVESAGKLGAAAAACCVTSLGGATGGRDYETTARMAGLT